MRWANEAIDCGYFHLSGWICVGRRRGSLFWSWGPELDQWISGEIFKPQLLLMGRKTYETFVGFSMSGTDERSVRMNDLPKMVFSNTLKGPLAWKNTSRISGELVAGINGLKSQPGEPIRSMGSLSLVRGLIQNHLVDRLRLMIFPLELGTKGTEPFFEGYLRTQFELLSTKSLDSRLILLEYKPCRRPCY
jgi:dihydrofolate reductase